LRLSVSAAAQVAVASVLLFLLVGSCLQLGLVANVTKLPQVCTFIQLFSRLFSYLVSYLGGSGVLCAGWLASSCWVCGALLAVPPVA
jgi:hypothetical protein